MKEEADSEKLLVRYLLGTLSEDEQLQVEKMFLSEDLCYERLLALENALFYDYAQGKLSPDERDQFERRFLTSEYNRRRAILASALIQKMTEAGAGETIELGLADRRPQPWWRSLRSYFSHQSLALRFSLSAFAIVLAGSTWLIVELIGLRNEFEQFRTRQAEQEGSSREQLRQERARADELSQRLTREPSGPASLNRGSDPTRPPGSGEPKRRSPWIWFRLTPAPADGQSFSFKQCYVPRRARQLRFRLRLREQPSSRSYQATILTADGVERWNRERLRVRRTPSGRNLVVRLPARLLGRGQYELRLKGTMEDGTSGAAAGSYYFTIIK
ncbi:MAG TPA: hypothetical protein VJ302_36635 [Blastocatellia bacterium]|nr:hypothetical protein [Blastocatellia bacterium]